MGTTKTTMEVIELVEEMRSICETLRYDGKRIRLVPTMGALHIGHGSLIQSAIAEQEDCLQHEEELRNGEDAASSGRHYLDGGNNIALPRRHCGSLEPDPGEPSNSFSPAQRAATNKEGPTASKDVVVIVSIFVNPKQFNNLADYVNYPNTRSADLEFCKRLNVRYVFAPTLEQLYPTSSCRQPSETRAMSAREQSTQCMVMPPDMAAARDLEAKSRPGHFKGMLTVVCKLFNIIRPHEAYFGEKDYQQLILVDQMSRDLNQNVRICPVRTVRDYDLLPFSSRNIRLSESERLVAPVMYAILMDARRALEVLDCAISDLGSGMDMNKCTKINSILTASMLTTLCLTTDENQAQMFNIDYLELRCAKDVTTVHYKQNMDLFDCELGCAEHQIERGDGRTLKTRLLISVIVGDVRLLDNIEVLMNLDRVSNGDENTLPREVKLSF